LLKLYYLNMSSYKLKSNSALAKRLKPLSKKGKIKHWSSHTSHLAYNKSTKQKRHLRKSALLDPSDWKRLKKMVMIG